MNEESEGFQVERLHYEKGKLDMRLSGPHAMNFMEAFVDLFEQNGGKNFLSMTMEAPAKGKRYDITITNLHGELSAAEKIERITQENKQLREFAHSIFIAGFECRDLEGGDIQELGTKHGLLIEEPYNPDKHGEEHEAEPGDPFYTYAPIMIKEADTSEK